MIEIKNLQKSFSGNMAVDIPELTISPDCIIGLVGNNGAGKTTLFRLMTDLIKASQGSVHIDGIQVDKSEDWKMRTGAFIDTGFLIDFLTAEEYFTFVGRSYSMGKEQINERLEAFHQLMNGEILQQKKYIRDYSAGNKQKIGIIAAMLHEPSLLILDEPFNFLDPTSQNVMRHLLREYQSRTGATIIVSSHNLSHTIDISDRVLLLEKGHLIKDLDNTGMKAKDELEAYFEAPYERLSDEKPQEVQS